MFQFRRFPTYAYFIQRRLTEYCSAGFPHSEISGSKVICTSPKLIAACHVLHRLLMPRHSPCALISLTYLGPNQYLGSLIKNHAGFRVLEAFYHITACCCFTHYRTVFTAPIKVPQLTLLSSLLLAPSSGIIITLFSFQGAASNLLRLDFNAQFLRHWNPNLIGSGGPKWTRTIDLTIISRVL